MLIIWDEAPLMNRLAFDTVGRHLKDKSNNKNAFGGKLVILETNTSSGYTWQSRIHCCYYSPSSIFLE